MTHFSSVSIFDFEQVNVSWDGAKNNIGSGFFVIIQIKIETVFYTSSFAD